ncbi:MAG: fluoride efflux transporter CrcB [Terrimicrobiaceae bacterium]|nr:fluoride efflux transporter CrcB [Terrimicrobiaceae bacterium]
MKAALAVMIGGALGSLLRYAVTTWCSEKWGDALPWGTFLVNVVGSFGIGVFAAIALDEGPLIVPLEIRALVMAGFFGGFTTFSAFSLQTLAMLQSGQWFFAAVYILASVAVCLFAVWLGFVAATAWFAAGAR